MYRRVTVIGLGSLGGFLCKYLSELDSVRELILVDFDIVESKNIFTSIYSSSDIGDYKVNALEEIINDNVAVTKINQRYVEGITKLPNSDLIIDCRDIVCDRKKEIDVRFYISGKVLMIDCRQTVVNPCTYNGGYSINLNKSEISKAAFFASQTVESGRLKEMITNNMIQRIDLDLVSSIMGNSIEECLTTRVDIIHEKPRLQRIEDTVMPILDLNRNQDVEVFIGGKYTDTFPHSHLMPNSFMIPRNTMATPLDVIQKLNEIMNSKGGVTNFIITIQMEGGTKYVELLEETGAA